MGLARTVALIGALALAACGDEPLPCYGTADCGGNTCCFQMPTLRDAPSTVYCTASPAACPPTSTVEWQYLRLCRTDADCVAGGISTGFTRCCRASVLSRAANTCASPSCT